MRTKIWLLVAALSLIAVPADADEDSLSMRPRAEEKETLRKDRLWHLAAYPLWHLAWIPVHETSHWLVLDAYGYETLSFRPYPHFQLDRDGGRTFYLGAVAFNRCTPGYVVHTPDGDVPCEDNGGLAAIAIAPYVTDIMMFGAADLLLSTGVVDPDGLAGAMLFVGGMLVPWVDFTLNMNTWGVTDRDIFTDDTGMSTKSVVLLSEVVSAVGVWRLIVNGKRVFYDRDRPSGEGSGLRLIPLQAEGATGLGLAGRW